MNNIKVTNVLLGLIAALLLANLLVKLPAEKVGADTFKVLDDCVTAGPADKPAGYVHVVTH